MDGVYYVSVSIVENQVEWIDYIEQAISFEVDSKDVYNSGKLIESSQGKVFMNGKITVFFEYFMKIYYWNTLIVIFVV
jgi:hypothetical protein